MHLIASRKKVLNSNIWRMEKKIGELTPKSERNLEIWVDTLQKVTLQQG